MTEEPLTRARRHDRRRGFLTCVGVAAILAASAGAANGQQAAAAGPTPGARALREMTDYLLGQWVAETRGDPGEGSGGFSLEASLDGNLVTRRSRADYPATGGRPAIHHEDVMVLYGDGGQVRADYVDNEGHVIHYGVAYAQETGTLTFVSPIVEGQPRYRLNYRPLGANRVEVLFEIAPPAKPTAFATYTKGICRRLTNPPSR